MKKILSIIVLSLTLLSAENLESSPSDDYILDIIAKYDECLDSGKTEDICQSEVISLYWVSEEIENLKN